MSNTTNNTINNNNNSSITPQSNNTTTHSNTNHSSNTNNTSLNNTNIITNEDSNSSTITITPSVLNNRIYTNEDRNSSIITVTPSVLNNRTTGPLFPISPFNVTNISAISAITEPTNNTLHFTQPPTQQNVSATSVISRCSRRKRKKPLIDHTPLHSSIPNIEPHRKRSKSRKRVGIQNNNNNNNSTTENNNNNNNQSPSIPITRSTPNIPNPTPNHRNSRNKRKNLSPSLLPYDYDNNNNKNKKRLPLIVNSIILFIFTFLSPIHFKPITLLCSTTWNGFISSYLSNENTPVIVNDDTSEFKSMIDNSDIDRTYTDYIPIFDNNNADNTQLAQSYTDEDIRNYVNNINNNLTSIPSPQSTQQSISTNTLIRSRRDCIKQHLNIDDSIFNISKIKTKNISKYCKQILYNEQKQIDAQSHLQLNNNNNNDEDGDNIMHNQKIKLFPTLSNDHLNFMKDGHSVMDHFNFILFTPKKLQ